jgi:hypothetical protein
MCVDTKKEQVPYDCPTVKPCPSCGRCPTCGKGGGYTIRPYPYPYWSPYTTPYITYTDTAKQPSDSTYWTTS